MATSRSMGLNMSLPTFTRTVSATVAGDDFDQQRMRFDADELNAALLGSGDSALNGIIAVSAAEVFVATKHRPLGQKGANRPTVNSRLQFVREDGKIDTLNCQVGFTVENGLTAQEMTASGRGSYVNSSTYIAQWGEAALCLALQSILGPSATSVTESLKRGLFQGIVLIGA